MSASQWSSRAYRAIPEKARPPKKRCIASTSAIAIGATGKATRRLCVGSPPNALAEPQVQPASSTAASAAPLPRPRPLIIMKKWKSQTPPPPPKFITTPMVFPFQRPTSKWKNPQRPPKLTSILPPPPLVSELNADEEDAEQPELQVDIGESEVTTPSDLDENEPEAATLSPPVTSTPRTPSDLYQDEFDKPKPSTRTSLINDDDGGWPTDLNDDSDALQKDVVVCWVEAVSPQVFDKMTPCEMPHEAYAQVTERIKNCASSLGQAVTKDGHLWTHISTAKGAARFAKRYHGQIICQGKYKLIVQLTSISLWPKSMDVIEKMGAQSKQSAWQLVRREREYWQRFVASNTHHHQHGGQRHHRRSAGGGASFSNMPPWQDLPLGGRKCNRDKDGCRR